MGSLSVFIMHMSLGIHQDDITNSSHLFYPQERKPKMGEKKGKKKSWGKALLFLKWILKYPLKQKAKRERYFVASLYGAIL